MTLFDTCPSCGRPAVVSCGCPVNEMRCGNNHQWLREQGGALTVMRGFAGWSHASDKHLAATILPEPAAEDWHALAVELAAATRYYLKANKLRCEVSRVSECGECAVCLITAAISRIETGRPPAALAELAQLRADLAAARAHARELAVSILKFADQA